MTDTQTIAAATALYIVIGLVIFGFILSGEEDGEGSIAVFVAVIWPVALCVALGALLRRIVREVTR